MKNNKKLILFFLFSLLTIFQVFGENKGLDLCDSVFDSLKKHHYHPQIQNLISNGDNVFPYNIYITFPGSKKTDETLLIIFPQEDFESNLSFFYSCLEEIKKSKFDFDIQILFSYGSDQKIHKENMVFGDEVFIESLDYHKNYSVLICNFDEPRNKIYTSSKGITTPAWMVKNVCETVRKTKFNYVLPAYYVSQQFRYKFYNDRQLNRFLENNIPAVKVNFASFTDYESTKNFIITFINNYSNSNQKTFDQHFLILNLFGNSFCFGETLIVKIIIVILFTFVLFLFVFFDINRKKQKSEWQELKSNWYTAPITYFLLIFGNLIGKGFYFILGTRLNSATAIYLMFSFELMCGFILTTLFYLYFFQKKGEFTEKSIDYLIIIITFLNQFIFLFLDVSLFPIFMVICVFALLSLHVKNNLINILLFVLTILPYVFYAHLLLDSAPINEMKTYLTSNFKNIFSIATAFCPIFLMYFRILTGLRNKYKSSKAVAISANIFLAIVFTLCITVSIIRSIQINSRNKTEKIKIIKADSNDSINISYSDKSIFNETIRNLKVSFSKEVEQTIIQVIGTNTNPVLYSDNSYINQTQSSSFFLTPNNPPQVINFNYGTDKKTSTVLVTLVYSSDNKNEFIMEQKAVLIEE